MLLTVLSGYIIAAAFAFCGVYQLVEGVGALTPESGYSALMHTIPNTAWPLAVACLVYTLTQIAVLVERNGIFARAAASGIAKTPSQCPTKSREEHAPIAKTTEDDPRYFRLTPPPSPAESSMESAPAPQETSNSPSRGEQQRDEERRFFKLH